LIVHRICRLARANSATILSHENPRCTLLQLGARRLSGEIF
jgi:hypothetical protein